MIDPHGRQLDYLRVSVTDRCNLRCIYCMPPEGVRQLRHEDLLTFEEIARTVAVGASLGLTKVRLTGGEPLVRKGVEALVGLLSRTAGVSHVTMTTNGILLAAMASTLRQQGLHDLNVSLDTLRADRYRRITRCGRVEDVLRGIDAALSADFASVKINTVVMRGINDGEIADFARLTLERPITVRFIEFMAVGRTGLADEDLLVPAASILERIGELGAIESVETAKTSGPAQVFRLSGAAGAIGVIAPVTAPFCRTCNRLRLTSEGRLRSCLIRGGEVDLRARLRGGASDEEIAQAFRETAAMKPLEYSCGASIKMSRIGG